VERINEFLGLLDDRQTRIIEGWRELLNAKRTHLKDSAVFLQTQTLGLIKGRHQRLAGVNEGLKRAVAGRIKGFR
jgi:hypothetical protein